MVQPVVIFLRLHVKKGQNLSTGFKNKSTLLRKKQKYHAQHKVRLQLLRKPSHYIR